MTTLLILAAVVVMPLASGLVALVVRVNRQNHVAPSRSDRGAAAPLLLWLLSAAPLALAANVVLHPSMPGGRALVVFGCLVACLVIGYGVGRLEGSDK